jgi:membrane-bound lytic murein transglycosylase MltF
MRKSLARLALLVIAFFAHSVGSAVFAETVTDRYDDTFRKYSQRFFGPGYDWRLFKAQAMAESNIDMNAKSWVGARGIMQLMPSTFREVKSRNPEMGGIDKPEWNIAAGVYYDRQLYLQWLDQQGDSDSRAFMMASYNAGRGTLLRAQGIAKRHVLDPALWLSITTIAPDVPRWRHEETITYVERIQNNVGRMDDEGRVVK